MLIAAALCAGVVFVLTFVQPRLAVAVALLGYAFVPFAAGMVSVGPILLHASTILVFVIAAARLFTAVADARRPQHPMLEGVPLGAAAMLIVFVAGVVLTEVAVSTETGQALGFFLNQIAAPIAVFLVCCDLASRYPDFRRQVARGVVSVAVAQSVMAILISRGVMPQPFSQSFTERFWWETMSEAGRQMGTTDHPLNLALIIAAAVPLLAYIERAWLRTPAFLFLLVGAALTQSRIGVFAVVVGAAYLFARGAGTRRTRFSTAVVIIGGYAALNAYGVFDEVFDRLANDAGSASVRSDSWSLLLPKWDEFALYGRGSAEIKPTMFELFGLQNSPESAFLGYMIAFGVPLTVAFFGALLWIAIAQISRGFNPGVASFVLTLAAIQFFSSISVLVSSASLILWLTVFLATLGGFDDWQPRRGRIQTGGYTGEWVGVGLAPEPTAHKRVR